ncbi:MAG: hypothetical protein K6A05_01100 [Lachnospiraceae bacterium]|nr:hypothetical protein [Lachnospiraceae bacterium]
MTLEEFLYLGRVDLFQYQRWGANFFLGVLGAVYLLLRRKRGDTVREAGLVSFITAVLFTFPGISWITHYFVGSTIGRSPFEIVPVAILAAEAGAAILEHEKNETLRRRIVLIAFLLFLIPAGISIGDAPTMDNIARHKSFTGVSEQTTWICNELHAMYGEDVRAVLPREFQMEVGIADTGVTCPVVDWRVEGLDAAYYVAAAREHEAHVIVIPASIADVDAATLNSNGFNIAKWLGEYEIWTDYSQ